MERYLVTGGAGFIGSNLVRHLVNHTNAQVLNLDKLTYAGNLDSLRDIESGNYRFVQGDIGNSKLITELLREFKPTAILNLAAESHVDRSIDGPMNFVQTNVVGTVSLLWDCLGYWEKLTGSEREQFRFLHVSTDEVYGSLGKRGKFKETTPYTPNSPYSASKAGSDHFVRAFRETYGLPTLTTNCSNNYGPYQFPEKLIPLMIECAKAGKDLPVYGDGKNVRDWLYVEDHCTAILTVLKGGLVGEVYNIGGNCEKSNLEIVKEICSLVDSLCPNLPHRPSKNLIKFVKDRPGHDRRYAIDSSKIQKKLGWKPKENLKTGLEKTVRWYLSNETWLSALNDRSESIKRQGLRGVGS